jgi:hypothetical protein
MHFSDIQDLGGFHRLLQRRPGAAQERRQSEGAAGRFRPDSWVLRDMLLLATPVRHAQLNP